MRNWRGALASLGAGVVWWIFAARNPTSTYHFAPSVVAAAWVAVEGTKAAGLTPRRIVQLAQLGLIVAVAITVGLSTAGNLEGPVFWSHKDNAPVVVEHLLFAVLGAAVGALIAWRHAARSSSELA